MKTKILPNKTMSLGRSYIIESTLKVDKKSPPSEMIINYHLGTVRWVDGYKIPNGEEKRLYEFEFEVDVPVTYTINPGSSQQFMKSGETKTFEITAQGTNIPSSVDVYVNEVLQSITLVDGVGSIEIIPIEGTPIITIECGDAYAEILVVEA